MAILRKVFESQYGGVELLPVSDASVRLGDIWQWKGLGLFGLFNYVLEKTAKNVAMIGTNTSQSLYDSLGAVELVSAGLADVEMQDNTTLSAGVSIPSLGLDLSESLKMSDVTSFQFQGLQARDCGGILANDISNLVHHIRTVDSDSYHEYIKSNQVAMILFYAGNVTLEINSAVDNETKAAISAKIGAIPALNVNVSVTPTNTTKYTMTGASSPFAGQLIQGSDL